MSDLLKALIDAAAAGIDPKTYDPKGDNTTRVAAVRAALAEALASESGADLVELERAAIAEFERRRGTSAHSAAALAEIGAIVDVVSGIRAEATARTATADTLAAFDNAVGKPVVTPPPAADKGTDQNPAGDKPAETTEPAKPGEQPATTSTSGTGAGADATVDEGAQQQTTEPVTAAGKAIVPAKSRTPVPLNALPNDDKPAHEATSWAMTAAADIPGIPMGAALEGVGGLVKAANSRLHALSRAGKSTTAGVAVLEREISDDKLYVDRPNDTDAVEYACSESRLPGGSLTAAASWCAPPELSYEFCDPATVSGLVDVPSVTARRGSMSWTTSPDFSAIYTQTGFFFPIEVFEGDDANRPDKPCYTIPCNGVTTIKLDVAGLCIQIPILQERAYPELTEYVMAQILAAHAHKMNAMMLRTMELLVTAANQVTVAPVVPPAAAPYGPGATATLLGLVELQVEYLRYKYRLDENATMEFVGPRYTRGILRSDLAKRQGVDMLEVTNADLDQHLRSRGVAPQWVLDWQDAFAGTPKPIPAPPTVRQPDETGLPIYDPTGFGGATPPKVWPSTVKFLLYPAGTYFAARNDIITVDGLYDSRLLARNMHLALFTEEGLKVAKRGCYEPILLNVPLCANGATGEPLPVLCPAA